MFQVLTPIYAHAAFQYVEPQWLAVYNVGCEKRGKICQWYKYRSENQLRGRVSSIGQPSGYVPKSIQFKKISKAKQVMMSVLAEGDSISQLNESVQQSHIMCSFAIGICLIM